MLLNSRPRLGLTFWLLSPLLILGSAGSALAQAPSPAPATRGSQSFLFWMLEASGPIGLVILLLSFWLITLIVWMALEYRRSIAMPEKLVRELTDLLALKLYNDAFQKVAESPSFLGRVLAAGVRKIPSGPTAAQRAMELANDDATMAMEHRTTYLATVGTLGPMIGLVGTVYGMILSFREIATAGGSPQASELAKGISTALFATLEGIAISIPAIFFYGFFRNRIARISLEVAMMAETFLEQFPSNARSMIHPVAASAMTPPRNASSGPSPS